jgi:uncharacterized protein (TIGR03086 family)
MLRVDRPPIDRPPPRRASAVRRRPAGGTIAPPEGPPPELVGDDPATQYDQARKTTIDAYAQPGVIEGMVKGFDGEMPAFVVLGIAFCDQLIHGWDLARATGQDATMPADLAALGRQLLEGRIAEDSRGPGKMFGPEVTVADAARDQDRLLAYCGRTP